MSQFGGFNAENKLRIPLSSYAAQIIESDCFSFSKKKTTLINALILNSYQTAECSISLRIDEYRKELLNHLKNPKSKENLDLINRIVFGKSEEMINKYAKRYPADDNWQITLSKRVKELLTEDTFTSEERYYGDKPGHYVRALVEEYAQKPYYLREEIIFKPIFETIKIAIDGQYALNLANTRGTRFILKPHSIKTDPLSMYHYLIGYDINQEKLEKEYQKLESGVVSLRISRLVTAEAQYRTSGRLNEKEMAIIAKEIDTKGVQFVTSEKAPIQVWLSEAGIKRFKSQAHLRPMPINISPDDGHIYNFECTDAQIMFYFFEFGNDAKIMSPLELADRFKTKYKEAYYTYEK